jgi:hypothetical protein
MKASSPFASCHEAVRIDCKPLITGAAQSESATVVMAVGSAHDRTYDSGRIVFGGGCRLPIPRRGYGA